jgi:hypothetical protein
MRRVKAVLSAVAIGLMAVGVAAQTKPTFAGEWKLLVASGQSVPGVDLTVTQSATLMTVEGRDGVKLTYKLDGSESKNMIPSRSGGAPAVQVSKAMWAGNTIVVITATGGGEEKRTFSRDGGYLVVVTSVPGRNGGAPTITKAAYQPYERGFGG